MYINLLVLQELKRQAEKEGITISKLCREKLRDYSLLANLQETLEHINEKISREQEILNLLKLSLKLNTKINSNRR